MAVPFAHGFNEVFQFFSASSANTISFQRARECWSSHIRFYVDWSWVQQAGPGSFWWKPQPGSIQGWGWDYEALRAQANDRDLRMLPIVVNCPTGWIPRNERWPTAGVFPSDPNADYTVPWYPISSSAQAHFANFCVETIKYFNNCNRCDAVEVWNEPNYPTATLSPYEFSDMLGATIQRVNQANANGEFNAAKQVISGGLYMDYQGGSWKNYLDVFKNQAAPFGIGIHPYDTRNHEAYGPITAANNVVARVAELYEQAANRTSGDLWVTETGASSRSPFGEDGQRHALRELAGAGGYFAGRARCKGVFIHRLYPGDDPGREGEGTPFYRFPVIRKDQPGTNPPAWTPKSAWWMLVDHWGP